ncbi:hypothetical protein D3C78_1476670 [compost metagenome]
MKGFWKVWTTSTRETSPATRASTLVCLSVSGRRWFASTVNMPAGGSSGRLATLWSWAIGTTAASAGRGERAAGSMDRATVRLSRANRFTGISSRTMSVSM